MFAATIIFIFTFPLAIYYCYSKPKHIDLLQVGFTLIFCNILIQLFQLIPNKENKITLTNNIDYSSIASISNRSKAKNNVSEAPKKDTPNNFLFQKNNDLNSNFASGADIVCSDCDNNLWGNNPDFSHRATQTNFIWPLEGTIIKSFSIAREDINEGINIAVPVGTKVQAIDDGTVSYSDEKIKGYGKMVIIRHDNSYVSVYAHNSKLKISKGYRVLRGQIIAQSGQTGSVQSPQLHFELRKGFLPLDPLKFLPTDRKTIGSN